MELTASEIFLLLWGFGLTILMVRAQLKLAFEKDRGRVLRNELTAMVLLAIEDEEGRALLRKVGQGPPELSDSERRELERKLEGVYQRYAPPTQKP